MKKTIIITTILAIFGFTAFAQDVNTINTTPEKERPTVALVLSGAGARGFAHIPVIELMEELGIPIDFVVGTSSGAIIGGLYSAGYTGREIADALVHVDWPLLLQDSTSNLMEGALGAHSSQSNLINLQLTKNLSLNLGRGLLSGQYVYNKLKSLTAKIPSYIDFDDLPTPYRATVVDLLSGELVFLGEGDLTDAIRSSMSIPGAFEPFPIDGRYYLDGFIKNNLPIEAAKELGYDIVIAVDMSDRMVEDANAFNSNPLIALNQILALQQAEVISEGYQYADLVILPDIYDFGNMDYGASAQVYEKGRQEAERYRDELLALRERIFPNEVPGAAEVITGLEESASSLYVRETNYADLSEMVLQDISMENAFSFDTQMIMAEFNKIKNKPITPNDIETFLTKAYDTGNYIMVTSRIDTREGETVLELDFYQKDLDSVQIGILPLFEGSLSNSASWEIALSTTVQFRDFNKSGGTLSFRGSVLNTSGLEIMYMYPLSEKIFINATLNGFSVLDMEHSGFDETVGLRDSHFRDGSLAFGFGFFFSPQHKLINEVGLHSIDPRQVDSNIPGIGTPATPINYSFDAYTRYIFDTLDYSVFPTKGFYSDISITGVVPLDRDNFPTVFDVVQTDLVAAMPFNNNFSMVLSGFIGTNITGGLADFSGLMPKYAFTTHDRAFFPHIMQRYNYGIHKVAAKVDFQLQPSTQLTVLGGQFFTGISGAIGGVWNDYETLLTFKDFDWQASAITGLRVKDSFGVIVRVGAGTYEQGIAPYASLDFVVKYY